MADLATLEGDGWRVQLPASLIAKDHKAWGYEGGSIARGWIGEAPVTVIVQKKRLDGTFNQWLKDLSAYWLEHENPRSIEVPGAKDARRIDGYIEFDGLGAKDDRERCITVAAKRGHDVWGLTIRIRPEDGIDAEIESIVGSFELVVEP
jgi:hypothetical protein